MDIWVPVSHNTSAYLWNTSAVTPTQHTQHLTLIPTGLATVHCCVGVRWLTKTQASPRITWEALCAFSCWMAWQMHFWLLRWRFWHWRPQYRTTLHPEHCIKALTRPSNFLTIQTFVGHTEGVLRWGYLRPSVVALVCFLDLIFHCFYTFWRQPRAEWSLLPQTWQW